jgi:hypothetical protein
LLAYVFWHIPRPTIAGREYEAAHREFHEALRLTPVTGLVGVRVFRLASIPWLEPAQCGYEDWHLLSDSAALDVLNASAVSSRRQLPHDRIAGMAANGIAGLYALRLGTPIAATHAYWMSKPAGLSYQDFESSLQPVIAAGCCLWGRRMTLGPTPEFCLHSTAEITPPYASRAMRLDSVFSHVAS